MEEIKEASQEIVFDIKDENKENTIFHPLNKTIDTEDEIGISVFIPPIIAAAAAALVDAMARRLGERLADTLFEKLVGILEGKSDDHAFKEEIISRLDRLEVKLDNIIRFLVNELPALLLEKNTEALILDHQRALHSNLVSIKVSLNDFERRHTATNAGRLRDDCLRFLELGYSILLAGKCWYMAGIYTMSAILPAYSKLISTDKHYAESLGVWASEYAVVLEPWTDKTRSDSFTSVKLSMEAELAEAQEAMKYPPTQDFLLTVLRVSPILWIGYPAFLSGNDENGHWMNGGIHKETTRVIKSDQRPSNEEFGYAILPWWKPTTDVNPHIEFARMHTLANLYQNRVVKYPKKIEELKVAEDTINNLLKSCRSLSKFKHW